MNAPLAAASTPTFAVTTGAAVRAALSAGQEIALLDVREEAPFALAHPLFAANLPLGRIELEALERIPRLSTQLVIYDNGEGLAVRAAQRLQQLGYTQISLLADGLAGWRNGGGEIFQDVNAPSKAFGELVEAQRHTPSLSAEEVQALLDAKADVVVVDARRFDEYNTMNIPGSRSVPGGELVLRIRDLAPDPATRVIVNCAGRTRSIIGTQSLVNAGLPNPVTALRNGTIGWTLAGQSLERGQTRRAGDYSPDARAWAAPQARDLADRTGVQRLDLAGLRQLQAETHRTTYLFDVRDPAEYAAGHLPAFINAPGGQLVQETDHVAPVRGARIVLVDDDGVRANMAAHWLAQMNWTVWVLDGVAAKAFSETGARVPLRPAVGNVARITPRQVQPQLQNGRVVLVDLSPSPRYRKGHIAGAWFALRTGLEHADLPAAEHYVLTSTDGVLAAYAAAEHPTLHGARVSVLDGGNQAWLDAKLPLETENARYASAAEDVYRRPYEGTDNAVAAMQAYLDWEYGLVAQLGIDGTHGFKVLQ
ncbi:rhodanese-like domain-containing protein [Amantichitinum ursilacus]|uniref:Molybdopterin biosynthesis protein MoeB n=1 Tax=Amantichitinum ursilacus TaxID=857265 RepID=A0A0N0GQT1_9NEIS|nr:rhodanese-like domain-containing protein [Amantichitinum ursilacus]KPC55031.1 molybdopterin biosynthesis protein MoeB [Amantichitinum ursilacus]